MNTKLLEKIDPAELIPAEIDLDGQADYISKTLGYHVDSVAQVNSDETTLLGILKEHGVQVFRPDGVQKYKAKYPKITIRKERFWGRMAPFIPTLVSILGCFWAFSASKSAGYWNGDPTTTAGEIWAVVGIVVLALVAVVTLFFASFFLSDWNRAIRGTLNRTDWVSFTLGTSREGYHRNDPYSSPVPKDVLMLAADLKSKSSKLGFTIQELHSATTVKDELRRVREVRNTFDPLLYVHYGNASFCIAQWDQPGWNVKHI